MIYILEEPSTGNIKIGHTERLLGERLADLQTGNSSELKFIAAVCWGTKDSEKVLHSLCVKFAVRGEWFTSGALAILQDVLPGTFGEKWQDFVDAADAYLSPNKDEAARKLIKANHAKADKLSDSISDMLTITPGDSKFMRRRKRKIAKKAERQKWKFVDSKAHATKTFGEIVEITIKKGKASKAAG